MQYVERRVVVDARDVEPCNIALESTRCWTGKRISPTAVLLVDYDERMQRE